MLLRGGRARGRRYLCRLLLGGFAPQGHAQPQLPNREGSVGVASDGGEGALEVDALPINAAPGRGLRSVAVLQPPAVQRRVGGKTSETRLAMRQRGGGIPWGCGVGVGVGVGGGAPQVR